VPDFEQSQFGTEYTGPERRLTREEVLLMISNAVTTQAAQTEERLGKHIDAKFEAAFKQMDERISAIQDVFTDHVNEAFPDGPLVGHKLDHEGRIKWSKTKEKLAEDMLAWIVKGAVGIVFLLVGLGALEWIKREFTK
jgi:hypothetical protein